MNHRFIINIDLPEGVKVLATARPLTRDQIEALALAGFREHLESFVYLSTMPEAQVGIVTEAAPAREEGGSK